MHHVASSPLPTRACPRYTCILLVLAFIVKANLLVRVYRNTEDTLVGRGTWTPAPAGIKVSLVHFATLLTWRLDHGLVPPSVERRYGRVRRLRALLVDTGVAIVLSLLAVGQLQLVEGGIIKSMRMGSTAIAAGTCVLEFSVVRVLGALSTLFLPCGVVVLWCCGAEVFARSGCGTCFVVWARALCAELYHTRETPRACRVAKHCCNTGCVSGLLVRAVLRETFTGVCGMQLNQQ